MSPSYPSSEVFHSHLREEPEYKELRFGRIIFFDLHNVLAYIISTIKFEVHFLRELPALLDSSIPWKVLP